MTELERLARTYTAAHDKLREQLEDLQREIEGLKRERMPTLRSLVTIVRRWRDRLVNYIDAHRGEFIRPRTVTLYGVKVGLQKQRGEMTWDSAESVVRRIRHLLPDQADSLISVTERPNKSALASLPAGTLRKIGVTITDPGDAPIVRPIAGDIERAINRMIDHDDAPQGN